MVRVINRVLKERKEQEDDEACVMMSFMITLPTKCYYWAWHIVRMQQNRNEFRVLVEKSQSKKPQCRTTRTSETSITMDLNKI